MEKIDFVITWVDGSDSEWLTKKQECEKLESGNYSVDDEANAECRYRADTEALRYWFRGVEKFAPWVNKIHFVTCGQKPYWLNEVHPKLNIVNHEDFIPGQYLPTFNARTIEMNLHRIDELAEHFVLFEDDMYLLQPLPKDLFFNDGNPVLDTNLRYSSWVGNNNWSRVMFNDYCIVNNSFDVYRSIKANWKKWFNVKELGIKRVRRNLMCFYANYTLPVSAYGHLAHPNLKSSMQEIWDRHPDEMSQTSKQKFRSDDQLNQWLLCAWNQARGSFYPARADRLGKSFSISLNVIEEICEVIRSQSFPQICLNDSEENTHNEYCMKRITDTFETILPEKSKFEK